MLALETSIGVGSLTRLLVLKIQDVLPSHNALPVAAHPKITLVPDKTPKVCLLQPLRVREEAGRVVSGHSNGPQLVSSGRYVRGLLGTISAHSGGNLRAARRTHSTPLLSSLSMIWTRMWSGSRHSGLV